MRRIICILVLLTVVFSCGKFTYGGAEGDSISIKTIVHSPEDSCCYKIMASRMVNSIHYVWEADDLSHSISCGEYYFTVFHAQDSLYQIEGLDAFAHDPSVSMQEVYASVPSLEDGGQDKMASFNPYASFVKPADALLLCAFRKTSAVGTSGVVEFSPKSLTQNLSFRLRIRPKDSVRITGVRAAVSGVAGRVRLMSGLVRNDASNPTFRQYVKMSCTGVADGVHVYDGSTSVLGLFAPSSHEYASGPGIFQVEIRATVSQDGEDVTRVFYAGINMKSVIEEASLMEAAGDRSGFRVIRSEALLVLPAVLEVGKDQVISGDGDGLEKWFVNDADIEIEI